MYSLRNMPQGYFEENNHGIWEITLPERVMITMKIYFGENADAYYDEIICAGIENRNYGFVSRPTYRWVSVL